ncbi:MAG: hypothetical protein ACOYJ6_20280 [Caulobacterales bacterium]
MRGPLDSGPRTWPNTERIKGWQGPFEVTGQAPRAAVISSAELLLNRYLIECPNGRWIDQFGPDGAVKFDTIPTSTLYQLFLALAEILHLEPRLSAMP